MADPVVARYRTGGIDHARRFDTLTDAFDFLRRGVDDGGFDVTDIESNGGMVIVSRPAFEELQRLDEAQRDGWLAVLSHRLAEGEAVSPRTRES